MFRKLLLPTSTNESPKTNKAGTLCEFTCAISFKHSSSSSIAATDAFACSHNPMFLTRILNKRWVKSEDLQGYWAQYIRSDMQKAKPLSVCWRASLTFLASLVTNVYHFHIIFMVTRVLVCVVLKCHACYLWKKDWKKKVRTGIACGEITFYAFVTHETEEINK